MIFFDSGFFEVRVFRVFVWGASYRSQASETLGFFLGEALGLHCLELSLHAMIPP